MSACRAASSAVKDRDIAKPSDMIAMGDANIWSFSPTHPGTATGTGGSFNFNAAYHADASINSCGVPISHINLGTDLRTTLTRKRHGGRFKVLFCDSHVENPRTERLFDWRRDEVLSRWNRDNIAHHPFDYTVVPP